eukprot:COSAG02_NODE_1283_length_13471_cov_12.121223_8_plen_58_part_00
MIRLILKQVRVGLLLWPRLGLHTRSARDLAPIRLAGRFHQPDDLQTRSTLSRSLETL